MSIDQNRPGGGVPSVTVQEATQSLQDGTDAVLVDVREMDEFIELRAHGATLIPLGTLETRSSELPRDRTLLMVCRSGARSGRATAFLLQQGFADVRNVDGGMIAWKNAGLSTKNGPLDENEGDL